MNFFLKEIYKYFTLFIECNSVDLYSVISKKKKKIFKTQVTNFRRLIFVVITNFPEFSLPFEILASYSYIYSSEIVIYFKFSNHVFIKMV